MPIFEAIRLALAQIRVQKLKSFFTLIGVAIGVMFLIAIVSIVEGVGRYMEDDLVGKLITKNSFDLRQRPNLQMGDVDESERRAWRSRPRITEDDIPVVVAALPPSARWAVEANGQPRAGVALREAAQRRDRVRRRLTGSTSRTWACPTDVFHRHRNTSSARRSSSSARRRASTSSRASARSGRELRIGRVPVHRDRHRREAGQRVRDVAGQVRDRSRIARRRTGS